MQLTSSEYEDLVNDMVSSEGSIQLKLADLEAKLEIISPEDLTVRECVHASWPLHWET
jgi:hypothetical protein